MSFQGERVGILTARSPEVERRDKRENTAHPYVLRCSDCPCQWSNQRGRPPIKYVPSCWRGSQRLPPPSPLGLRLGGSSTSALQTVICKFRTDEVNVTVATSGAGSLRFADYNGVNNLRLAGFFIFFCKEILPWVPSTLEARGKRVFQIPNDPSRRVTKRKAAKNKNRKKTNKHHCGLISKNVSGK